METLRMITVKISAPFPKHFFDKKATQAGKLLLGVDEVGRGCLAGPVTAAAVIIKPLSLQVGKAPLITDSKALDKEQREKAYNWLLKNSWYAVASIDHRTIDTINIYQATLQAMHRAIVQLCLRYPEITPSIVLVDSMPLQLPFLASPEQTSEVDAFTPNNFDSKAKPLPSKTIKLLLKKQILASIMENPWGKVIHFNYGELQSRSIAAASIIAKVTRDNLMAALDPVFPGYNLGKHKGYATPEHKTAVTKQGMSLIHRVSFIGKNTSSNLINESLAIQQNLMIEF